MPTFLFDIDDGSVHAGGKLAMELPDIAAASAEAAALAGELLRERARDFWNTQEWKVTVEDSSGLTLFVIVVAAIVSAAAQPALARGKQPPS